MRRHSAFAAALFAAGVLSTACAEPAKAPTTLPAPTSMGSQTTGPPTTGPPTTGLPTTGLPTTGLPTTLPLRPDWLGLRTLPTDALGFGVATETPTELIDRRFVTIDTLPPPTGGFEARVQPIPDEVLARSTWREGCPVAPEDLRYLQVSFHGFDGLAHTGELIVAATVAEDIVTVFRVAWDAGYPFEEMRVVTPDDLEAAPTGDGNNTSAFVCRGVTGGSAFSQHAYGQAIDINPFQNPYVKADLVLPELARSYGDRSRFRTGMLLPGDPVVEAFAAIGWQWGGDWSTLKDWQHFSPTGR